MGVLLGLGLLISALGLALGGKRVNAGWSIDKDCYTAKLVDNRQAALNRIHEEPKTAALDEA